MAVNSKLIRLKESLKSILMQFESERLTSDKGLLDIQKAGNEIAVGDTVMGIDEDENEVKVENGDYTLTDGTILKISDGKIDDIVIPEKEEEEKEDKEEFSEEEMPAEAPQVEEPAVEEPAVEEEQPAEAEEEPKAEEEPVVENEPEAEEEPVEAEKEKFEKQRLAFEQTYDEKYRKIADAIYSLGYVDSYVIEAADDYAIAEIYVNDGYKDYRFTISWVEDNPVIGEKVEVVLKYVPVEDKEIENFKNIIVEKDTEIGKLQTRISELEKEPAAEPASKEFAKVNKVGTTGDERLDNLARFLKK